jgi:hypothetical protein
MRIAEDRARWRAIGEPYLTKLIVVGFYDDTEDDLIDNCYKLIQGVLVYTIWSTYPKPTYVKHTYRSHFIPERVAEASQIFLRGTHVLPKLVSYEEYCRRDRCRRHRRLIIVYLRCKCC